MNKKLAALFLMIAAGAAALRAQAQYGGYLSMEYIKGQSESLFPRGSLENLRGGFLAGGRAAAGSKFGFALEVRFRSETLFELEQAWVGFLPSQAINVRGGMFLVPFGAWNQASRPHETPLIRTPLNLEYLYPASWRDLGLVVEGQFGVLSYAGYIGNGLAEADELSLGQQFRDNNSDKAKGGRLGLSISRSVRIGVSYYRGKYDLEKTRDLTLEGLDLSWVTAQWEVHGEYTKALIENPEPFARGESEGFSVWTFMSLRSFQPVGSFQKVKYEDPYHGGGFLRDQSRWTLGLRYVLSSNLFLKIEYDWNEEKGPVLKNNMLQLQAAMSF